MAELSYAFYRDIYHGSLSEADFSRALVPAGAYLKRITASRADFDAEPVQLALCAVAEVVALEQQGGSVAAERNDTLSVTYFQPRAADAAARYQAAADFLAGTGLLYRGVDG